MIGRFNIHNRGCGFFSDFNLIMSAIYYFDSEAKKDFYIDWRNPLYSSDNSNLFDKYFYQKNNESMEFDEQYFNFSPWSNRVAEYTLQKTNKDIYHSLLPPSLLIKKYSILDSEYFKNLDHTYFAGRTVLGVHKRGTDHSIHGQLLGIEEYFFQINLELKSDLYGKIFLITDEEQTLDAFKKEYGDMLLHTDSFKSTTNNAIHYNNNVGPEVIATEVLRDAYFLSLTDFKLITRSNVSIFSLLCNLKIDNFRFIDNHITYR